MKFSIRDIFWFTLCTSMVINHYCHLVSLGDPPFNLRDEPGYIGAVLHRHGQNVGRFYIQQHVGKNQSRKIMFRSPDGTQGFHWTVDKFEFPKQDEPTE
jgi:hypothetical protein